MKYIDLSFPTPEENLACDEAFLDLAEEGSEAETLRFWESNSHFIVLGYSRKHQTEINLKSCTERQIPILRRPSGGGTVLQGPGCFNYSLVLKLNDSRPLHTITETNRYVLSAHKKALEPATGKTIQVLGTSDLACNNLKFSGNAQRRKKSFILFHGTFLLDFPIPLIEEVLAIPQEQPEYRNHRTHREFLMNLEVSRQGIKKALTKQWRADEKIKTVPRAKMNQLIEERYSKKEWNFKY